MKTSSVFFRHKFRSIISSPLFWINSLVMVLASAIAFFTRTKFFTPAGTSSLTAYFSYVPYVSVILVPAFCLKKNSAYDDFVPLSTFRKNLLNFASHISAYGIMMVLLLWMPLFVSFYGDIDSGEVFLSFLALIFYGLSAVSLCFLISDITGKAVSAFAVSSLVLAAFNSCHLLPVYFSLPKFFTGLFYASGFAGRFENASRGIFSSSDFIFYVLVSSGFLFCDYLVLEIKKGFVFNRNHKTRIFYSVLLFILLFAYNGKFRFTLDFSSDKIYSLSSYSKKLLKECDRTVSIHFYKSGKLEALYPEVRNVRDFLKQYERNGSNVILKVTDCDRDSSAREFLSGYGIYPQRIRTDNSTSTEFTDVYSAVVLECGGNIGVVPFVLSPANLEYQISLKLLELGFGVSPEFKFISGNGMELEDDLRLFKEWFNNQGIAVKQVRGEDLSEMEGPLVVTGESILSENEAQDIFDYAEAGKGSILFLNSPYSVDVRGDWSVFENTECSITNGLTERGINYRPSMVLDYSCQRISMMSEDTPEGLPEIINYPLWLSLPPQENAAIGINVFWTSPLELTGNAVPYLVSSSHSGEKLMNFDETGFLIETNPFKVKLSDVQTSALQNQVVGCFLPVTCTDNAVTKCGIYVISDQYFASFYTNGFIGGENGDFRNFVFLTGLFWEMNGYPELAALHRKTIKDRSLYKRSMR